MGYYRRNRSEFWYRVFDEEDSYSVVIPKKYVPLINGRFPELERLSPRGWREVKNNPDHCRLWIPPNRYEEDTVHAFEEWVDHAAKDVLWLPLSKSVRDYFSDELDFCLACDFNFIHDEGRTEMGEAEYQLKYNSKWLSQEEKEGYLALVYTRMNEACNYVPGLNADDWYVSPMPSSTGGRQKFAWNLSEGMSGELGIQMINPELIRDKPEMKELPIEEKIQVWNDIYTNGGVRIDRTVRDKNILIIDDLYQSGTTMWQYARFLKSQGAKMVFGIVCVKSLKDSDNT